MSAVPYANTKGPTLTPDGFPAAGEVGACCYRQATKCEGGALVNLYMREPAASGFVVFKYHGVCYRFGPSVECLPKGAILLQPGAVTSFANCNECAPPPLTYSQARKCSDQSLVDVWMAKDAALGVEAFKVFGEGGCLHFNHDDPPSTTHGTLYTADQLTQYPTCTACDNSAYRRARQCYDDQLADVYMTPANAATLNGAFSIGETCYYFAGDTGVPGTIYVPAQVVPWPDCPQCLIIHPPPYPPTCSDAIRVCGSSKTATVHLERDMINTNVGFDGTVVLNNNGSNGYEACGTGTLNFIDEDTGQEGSVQKDFFLNLNCGSGNNWTGGFAIADNSSDGTCQGLHASGSYAKNCTPATHFCCPPTGLYNLTGDFGAIIGYVIIG